MWKIVKNWFKKPKPHYPKITTGKPDDKGIVQVFADGKPTNVTMLIWTEEEVKRLREIAKKLQNEK